MNAALPGEAGEVRIRRVVIAGGGTAGWSAAAALAAHLGPLVSVTLVESDALPTIGVGESTIPTARSFHRLLGLDESALMRAAQATFKLGIRFTDWGRLGDDYMHALGRVGRSTWMCGFQHLWLEACAGGYGGTLEDYCLEAQAARGGRFATGPQSDISYAYHLDAGLYAGHLRQFSEARGVTRIEGRIAEVRTDGESGFIEALALEGGRLIEGDLFLDCTGFAALLSTQALGVGFEDWGKWIPTDRALAVQSQADAPPVPYTLAAARPAGWQWRIPLQHRIGNGLVYCSDYMTDEAAAELLQRSISAPFLTEPRLVRFRTGRLERVWEKNCIALGLASGFVEPLESTSIHLIQIGIIRLIQHFPFMGIDPALRDRFNALAAAEIAQIRDFVLLHYVLTERDDSAFWRDRREVALPESLAARIALFENDAHAFQAADDLFQVDSWVQVMLGQGLRSRRWHPMGVMLGRAALEQALDDLHTNIAAAVGRMPSHGDFIRAHCAAN